MKKRAFGIPSLTALALPLGCGPEIVGSWEVVEVDGEEYPVTYSYTYHGTTIQAEILGEMQIDLRLEGFLMFRYVYTYDDQRYSGELFCEARAEETGERRFEIELSDGCDMSMACTAGADGDRLNCENTDGVSMIFEREQDE